ncbi:MAG: radical SAM protein [Deltaproteobacteria bacterium]|nr:radical SAM protein [Deltaproteobacteria bacterium]
MSSKPKVLLLNPPGIEIYIRDYYCSKVSKTNYIYTPVDLLIVSARLKEDAHVHVIDAIAEQLNDHQVVDKIQKINPDVIVMLISAVSWHEDLAFLKKIRTFFQGKIIGSGDALMDDPKGALEEAEFLDAILLDFTSREIVDFCQGKNGPFSHIFMMGREMAKKLSSYTYDIPIPQHHLFPHVRYVYPFVRRYPFATVLTDFGCAFRCTFCIQSTLDFKARTIENVMEELKYLKTMGFKDIYFSDQTFAHNISRAQKLFEVMISKNLNLGWVAFYRTDLVQEPLLKLMRKSGCHTLMFGIETANERLLVDYKKNIKLKTTLEALRLCKKYGIRTVGTIATRLC